MTEEEYFRKHYPDVCYNGKPLSPYWDLFQDGVEFGERQSEKKIEKMKCCGNCRFDYCERSSECIDKDGNRTFHCWNVEKRKYCDVGKNGKYQCWEIKEND